MGENLQKLGQAQAQVPGPSERVRSGQGLHLAGS